MVADGASANRKFFRLHSVDEYKRSGVTYLAPNVCCAPGDKVYFVVDHHTYLRQSHVNACYNSQSKKTHHLTVCCGHYILMVCYYASCRTMEKKRPF